MYKYNFVNNDEFKISYKKYLRKYLLKGTFILISIATILLFSIIYFQLKRAYQNNIPYFGITILILLLLESFLLFIAYKKEVKILFNGLSACKTNLSFNEKGILIIQDDIEKFINWNAVRNVIIADDNLVLNFKIIGFPGNLFYFNFFDSPKEVIVSDIKKYIKVKEVK